jgi:hypothetical protein
MIQQANYYINSFNDYINNKRLQLQINQFAHLVFEYMIPIPQVHLGEITGIIALVVSGFAIYISHFYTSRREQIKTSQR